MELDKSGIVPVLEESPKQQVRDEPESSTEVKDARPPQESTSSAKLQEITDRVLQFLSTASNETLGACVAALCAFTYLILGRVGLVLIGVVGGVVLHATWEGSNNNESNVEFKVKESRRRRELGAAVAQKALDWRETRRTLDASGEKEGQNTDITLSTQKELDFGDYQPATGAALRAFTDAVIRDYVKWWYDPILPAENAFPSSCRQMLNSFVLSVSGHLSRKRPVDTFLDFLTNSSSIVIVFLNELSAALMASDTMSNSPAEAVRKYLGYNPESNLANVLSVKQQRRKLDLVADDILQNFLNPKAYKCEPVKVFLQQAFAVLILESTINNTSRAEWINEWIVYLLEDGEPDILTAIDAGVDKATPSQLKLAASAKLLASSAKEGRSPEAAKGQQDVGHRRRVSRAEDAMEQAMMEAQRLSEMIAAEEAMKSQDSIKDESVSGTSTTTTTEGVVTPTSSDSDRNGFGESSHETTQTIEERPLNASQPTTPKTESSHFTSFDQLASWQPPTPAIAQPRTNETLPFTLHNASVTIIDYSLPGEKAKPNSDFLLQIEPASSQASGWMIPRKYQDFEALHEFLRRIAAVSGVSGFTQQYGVLPIWKGQTKLALREELERYLRSALKYERLAESGGMKKFLEKDQGLGKVTSTIKPAFAFPSPASFETMGKGVLDVLGNAPKGVMGGGKAVLGGVSGVFGVVGGSGQKKPKAPVVATRDRGESVASTSSGTATMRESQDELTISTDTSRTLTNVPPLPRRPSNRASAHPDYLSGTGASSPSSNRSTTELNRPHLDRLTSEEERHLPPPPSAISDDYGSPEVKSGKENTPVITSPNSIKKPDLPERPKPKVDSPSTKSMAEKRAWAAMSEEETQMAIELFFAIIQELYTLSSAWNIRRTLLNAAKSFLLRPGNPNLESIRLLLQKSLIDANTSDSGIAAHILKLRENTLPTEEELKQWPPPPTAEEKERLRLKARRLLIERGMPQALTSVMGAAASGEALGRVFDCLQIEEIARGLMFALLLQGLRAATQ